MRVFHDFADGGGTGAKGGERQWSLRFKGKRILQVLRAKGTNKRASTRGTSPTVGNLDVMVPHPAKKEKVTRG